jgi:MFS family permease
VAKKEVTTHGDLDEPDKGGISKLHRKVLFISGMGFFTDAYDLFIIGVALSLIKLQWHPSVLEVSLVSSTALIAAALGATIFGRLADRWGRTRIYGFEVLLLAGGAIATALSPNIWWLIIFRFIVGLGIGGDYPVSATIMSEYADSKSRGRMVSLVFSMQALGLIVGPLIAVALLTSGLSHELDWRLMLGLGAIPGLVIFRLRRRLSETPRFAMAAKEALKVKQLSNQAKPTQVTSATQIQSAPSTSLKHFIVNKRLRRWLIGTASTWFLLDFAFYGNTISSPVILKLLRPHASLITTTIETLCIFVLASAPGYFVAAHRIDTQGRKSIQCIGFAVMAGCFIAIGIIPGLTKLVVPFLALYGLSYFFTQYGPNTTTFVYPTELFPTRLRTTGHGISAAAGKLGAFIGTFSFPLMLTGFGLGNTEILVGGVCLLGLFITVMLLPETRGQSLETISKEFVQAEALSSELPAA